MHRTNLCLDNVETVTGDLRECVAALRGMGQKTTAAIERVAKYWHIQPRRVVTLFYRNQSIMVSSEERRRLALRAAEMLDDIAARLEEKAEISRAKAEAIRNRERLKIEPLGCGGTWQSSIESEVERAA